MGEVKNFDRLLAFLLAQGSLLALLATYDWWLVVHDRAIPSQHFAIVGYFAIAAVAMAAIRLAWSGLLESAETYWGTSARVRISRWMQPALLASSMMLLLAVVIASLPRLVGDSEILDLVWTMLAFAVPFGVTALLLYSALRRWQAIRGGLQVMRDARQAVAPGSDFTRIDASLATQCGTDKTTARANPQGFAFAGLTSKPWHDPADFPWIPAFVEAVDEIRAEAQAVLNTHENRIEKYHYVGLDGDFWRSFKLATRHEELPANLALCPTTASLLKTIPGYPGFRDAMFSILGPGGVISRHRDVSNVFLTLHLPLVVPGDGYIEVGGIRREWREKCPLIFDSSYSHEAANLSEGTRVVLLVDFPHPDLSDAELAWVHAARL